MNRPSGRHKDEDLRCRFTWNPGKWPYIQRCPQRGVEEVPEFNDEPGSLFCGHHARQLKRQIKSEGKQP